MMDEAAEQHRYEGEIAEQERAGNLLAALTEHLVGNGSIVLTAVRGPNEIQIVAGSEWGTELEPNEDEGEPGSSMAGGAAYGVGDSAEEALTMLLRDTTLRVQ